MNIFHQTEQPIVELQIDDEFATKIAPDNMIKAIERTISAYGQLDSQINSTLVTVVITNDAQSQELNASYRGVDAPTDVLSFANQDVAVSENDHDLILPPELMDEMGQYLGDLIIAYPYTVRQAAKYGNSVEAELRLLAVHGTLHLLGYDHNTAEEEAIMWTAQKNVLKYFGDAHLVERVYS